MFFFEEALEAPLPTHQLIDLLSLPGFAEVKAHLEGKGFPSAWITKTVDLTEKGAIFLENGRPSYKSKCVNYKGFWLQGCIGSVQCDVCKSLLPGLMWDTTCKEYFENCPFYLVVG